MDKKLFIRLDASLYTKESQDLIVDFFNQFFKNVTILDIFDQTKDIAEFVRNCPHKVISMDKYIPLEHNIDASRVFDINGNYLYHNFKFNGKMARNEHVVLYDHDAVGGFQLKMLSNMLESQGCTVETKLFIQLNKEEAKQIEILDLDDFINQGLVVDMGGVLRRVPYFLNPEILESRASIPKHRYEEFKFGLLNLLSTI